MALPVPPDASGSPCLLERGRVEALVRSHLTRNGRYLDMVQKYGSPLYFVDEAALADRARQFRAAFESQLQAVRCFYAVKSNNHPFLAKTLLGMGFGLDVSSGIELEGALALGATDILFSGPGKTASELALAAQHHERVTVLMDSFGELERLEREAAKRGLQVRAGVRLMSDERGLWRKFGIPLHDLYAFWEAASRCSHVTLCGLQFHASWNLNPGNQMAFIARLGQTLSAFEQEVLSRIEFVDIGGGYWPAQGEWLHPADEANRSHPLETSASQRPPVHLPAVPIEQFAEKIGRALQEHLYPHLTCAIYLEPGRWVCHDAMHILLRVVDKKERELVITDAGTNTVGWERYETDYFPVINLSRPSLEEVPCLILGSLCTPHDVWGYRYFGGAIEPNDVLLVPSQGAYTYSLRQRFIKPLPRVVIAKGSTIIAWDDVPWEGSAGDTVLQ
ncbi:MAG: alanine racemase [Trueperaceae bacterium]|nr:MAG: alanine racemase [Trueperaceae bacterium]